MLLEGLVRMWEDSLVLLEDSLVLLEGLVGMWEDSLVLLEGLVRMWRIHWCYWRV